MDAERLLESKLRKAEEDGNIGAVVETLSLQDKTRALLITAKSNWYKVMIYLIDHGIDVHYVDSRQNNLLNVLLQYSSHGICENRFLQCIDKLVDAGVDANQLNEDTDTAMSISAKKGLYKVVMYLVDHGIGVQYVDSRQNNLLHILLCNCIRYDYINNYYLLQCVVKLVDVGVDVNQLNEYKDTPISISAIGGLYKVVMYLVDHGIGVQYVDSRQNNLLHILLCNCNRYDYINNYYLLQCVVKLVDVGVDVNQLNEYKDTPISISAIRGLYKVVTYLVDRGIDVQYVDSRQNNLLNILLYNYVNDDYKSEGHLLRCVVKLVASGVDVNQVNDDKQTPIHIAARKGLYQVVTYLLDHGIGLPYVDIRQNNLIHLLLNNFNTLDYTGRRDLLLQYVVKLVDAGVDVNQLNEDKDTSISIAARKQLHEVVIYMLEHGVDVYYVDSRQNNLLHLLLTYDYCDSRRDSTKGRLNCVVKLVDAGVDVNQLNEDKETPISIAAQNGLYDVVIYLLDHGVGVHCVDRRQNNLLKIFLYSCSRYNNVKRPDLWLPCLVKLVEAGVDISWPNEDNEMPVFAAAREGLYEVVTYLLEHGVDVGYVDSRQNNLMHTVLDRSNRYNLKNSTDRRDLLQCIVKLVDAGVNVNQLNRYKDTPLLLAARKGLFEIVTYLFENGFDMHYVDSRQNNLIHLLLDGYDKDDYTSIPDLLQCVVKLVDAGVDANQLNEGKETPIVEAARKGLYEIVMYMLDHGVDLNFVDYHRNNLLNILLQYYNSYINACTRDLTPQCVYKIVNDNVDDVNNRQNIPLDICLDKFNLHDNEGRRDLLLQCVAKLADAGVEVNQANKDNVTPLFMATRSGLYEIVMCMLEHGVDVHYVDRYKWNILHYVLGCIDPFSIVYAFCYVKFEKQYIQLVNTLINTGLDINQPDYKGKTPLFHVGIYKDCKYTHPANSNKAYSMLLPLKSGRDIYFQLKCKLINILLKAGCNVNHQNTDRQTALMYHLIQQADISILKLLIPHSDLNLTDYNGDTAISYCVKYHMINSTAIFKLLVDSGSNLMSCNNGVKLFHDILKCKRLGMFSYYIRLKLIVNGVTAEGENMLHLLARVNYDYSPNKFNWLLNNDLDINHPCSKSNTPTMIAAFLINSKYLELLTRHPRLDINAQNNQGHTALHLCIIGFTMIKDGLNKRQVNDVVKEYCRQIYPIYMACIDSLLGVDGIDVNIPDHRGRTNLMMAVMKNDRVLTRKLLQAGAIVTMLDYSGRSALQYLDIYQSAFDLTCFKLLLSNGNTGLLNIPCIDGNTIIQTALCFPRFWEPCCVVRFIRYLVAENCCLQNLVKCLFESSYKQIDLTDMSSSDRDKLRKLLYLSGAQAKDIMITLNFDEEDKRYEDNDIILTQDRGEFISFCSNVSLKFLCSRQIRQNLGLGLKDKVRNLELPRELNDFLLLKDILHPEDYIVDHIDDGWNDFDNDNDYDGYDLDDRDDDYSQYNYQYSTLNTDQEIRQNFLKTLLFPNGLGGAADAAASDYDWYDNSFGGCDHYL